MTVDMRSSSADPTAIPIELDPMAQRMRGTTEHGHIPFDVPYISQIRGNLWQGGCMSGLVLPAFFEHVISLYPWEQYTLREPPKSASFHWLYDDNTQDPPKVVWRIASWVAGCVAEGPTLVHCQAGLNRSSLVAALVLMGDGLKASAAIAILRERRSPAVLCNKAFEGWLLAQGGE